MPGPERLYATHMSTVKRGRKAMTFGSTEEIISFLASEVRPGDHVVIMSNGGFDNIHNRLLEKLRRAKA